MAKEILLYGSIYSFSAQDFVTNLEAAKNEDLVVRINTNGGGVEDSWSAIGKFKEHSKNKLIKVDGKAYSMGLYFLCYADDSECLDVSQFLLHRASYGSYMEQSTDMTEDNWSVLNKINAKLRAAFEAKVDVKKFEKITGYTLDQVFSNEGRLDVTMTSEQALAIGLVQRVNQITPEIKAFVNSNVMRIAAEVSGVELGIESNPKQSQNKKTMNLEQLKSEHPSVFADAVKVGVNQERDRVCAHLAFVDIDAVAVTKGIKDGVDLTATAMAEFSRKAMSAEAVVKIEKEAAPAVTTTAEPDKIATAQEKELEAFQTEVRKNLRLK